MKKNVKSKLMYLSVVWLGLSFSVGCTSQNTTKVITVQPAPNVITPDSLNEAKLDVTFDIPANYISSRSRIVITPQLVVSDSVIDELSPVAIYSPIYYKKAKRALVLNKKPDSYWTSAVKLKSTALPLSLPYSDSIELPEGVETARVMGVVSVDGCGECSGIDTLEIAAVGSPISLIKPKENLKEIWLEPEFQIRPKVMEGSGVANMQFVVNRYNIDLSMGNNRQELRDMLDKLGPILSDSLATLNSLEIFGKASAEGSLAHNITLSRNRANSAKQWLVEQLNISPGVRKMIVVGSRPEGWEPVLEAMIADNHPDAYKVKAIMEKYVSQNDDFAEYFIRRLPCWQEIYTKYLQKDRKVEYAYSYTMKSFTNDAELIDMFKKRPDAFNEDEFLRVAALAVDDESRKEVYRTLLQYYPQSSVAANNLAILLMREGNTDEARRVLSSQKEPTSEQLNTLALTYITDGDDEKAMKLLRQIDLPEAGYNLGLLKAKNKESNEAYSLLSPDKDVNAAIAALSLNRNEEAAAIINAIDDDMPLTAYVRALVAARSGDKNAACEYLTKACADDNLRRRAADEPDFSGFRNESRFKSIIGK